MKRTAQRKSSPHHPSSPLTTLHHPSPVLAITAGDPCGIGPEVILKTLAVTSIPAGTRLVVIGDLPVFKCESTRLRRPLPSWQVVRSQGLTSFGAAPVTFLDCGHPGTFAPGRSSGAAGAASLAYLDRALTLWGAGHLQALVTAPVTKWAIAKRGGPFAGQTEYLARAMKVRDVVMMFVSDRLRVALLTRHLPLDRVSRAVTGTLLRTTARLTAGALKDAFQIERPRLAVCGLNPHAGEESARSEERTVMRPVLRSLERQGLRCDGPFAADGFFARMANRYDAVICAYHDQGLIPFKMLARDAGCQLSIGLPIVRTSPDHGSALDIAGRDIANPGSMIYALTLAAELARTGH